MKNLFSSPSQAPDLQKFIQLSLQEQRAQRNDLAQILRAINRLINEVQLQKQVDDYFEDDKQNIPEAEHGPDVR